MWLILPLQLIISLMWICNACYFPLGLGISISKEALIGHRLTHIIKILDCFLLSEHIFWNNRLLLLQYVLVKYSLILSTTITYAIFWWSCITAPTTFGAFNFAHSNHFLLLINIIIKFSFYFFYWLDNNFKKRFTLGKIKLV